MSRQRDILHVIGGTYSEYCAEPDRKDLFGSGLRAAAALTELTKLKFHTYADEVSKAAIVANAAAFRVPISIQAREHPISFDYAHPLATPVISPSIDRIKIADPIKLSVKSALCFGMLEGTAKVKAEQAVYDPQSPINPRPFSESESTADRLAIVLNSREAFLLAGEKSGLLERAAKKLFSDS